MEIRCRVSNVLFEVTEEDLDVFDRISPVLGGKKYDIPPPTLSPACRFQLRLAFRNERFLYRRKSDLEGDQKHVLHDGVQPLGEVVVRQGA